MSSSRGKRCFLQNVIAYLDANPDENDVTFLVGPHEEEVEALKLALKASCPALDKLFKEKWDTERAKHKLRISLPELDPTAFRVFLQVILWDDWSADAFDKMDLEPETISHLLDLSDELDMPELHKILYSLNRRFPSLKTNPALSHQIPTQDKREFTENLETNKSSDHILANQTQKLATNSKASAVNDNQPGSSRTVGTTKSVGKFVNDISSHAAQNGTGTTAQQLGHNLFLGGDIIKIIHAPAQNQAPPVTTFVQIDSPTPSFTGREDLLQTIHLRMQECFTQEKYTDRIVVLYGLGGIGKSELARMYAQSNINDPIIQNIAWIDAETKTSLKSSFDSLAKKLELAASTKVLETVQHVYTHFSNHVKTGLFIFDNAPQFNEKPFGILEFLPVQVLKHKPLVIITSREQDWKMIPKNNIIQVESLNEAESLELVIKLLQPSFNCNTNAHSSTVNTLVDAFQGFPLGISLAASVIEYYDETDFNDEIENYVKRMNVPLGGWAKDKQTNLATKYDRIMEDVWDISLEKIQKQGKDGRVAIHLLKFMAYLPTDGITVQLMSHLYNFLYGQSVTRKNFSLLVKKSMANVARVSAASLNISFDHNTKVKITTHKLVQHITREKLDARKDYFYLSEICDFFANMKLQDSEFYSEDAVVCLHEHLKVREWPRRFIRYSVIFCSFLTFFETQNLERMYTIVKDVWPFLEMKNLRIEELQTDKMAVDLFTLCCLWINNSLEKSVAEDLLEPFLDSKLSKQRFELSFQSLQVPLLDIELLSKMDLPFLHKYLYTFCYQLIYHFIASKMQENIASATSHAVHEYKALMGEVVHEDNFVLEDIFERQSENAVKQALEKFYFHCKPATGHDPQVYTNNLLQSIQTKFRQFQNQNQQNKAHAEELLKQEIRICQGLYTNAIKKIIENQNPFEYKLDQLHVEISASISEDFRIKHLESPLLSLSLELLSHQLNEVHNIFLGNAKQKLDTIIQRANTRVSKAADYYKNQMEQCKNFHEFYLKHSQAKQRAIEHFKHSDSIPDEILAGRLASLRSEISSIRIKTLCSLDTKMSTSIAESKSNRVTSSSATFPPSLAIGIDFGTTSCSVAILQHPDKMPQVLKIDFGQNKSPSYVSYVRDEEKGRDGELHVFAGETAKKLGTANPEFTLCDIKRFIGRSFQDPHIQKYKEQWPFHVVDVQGFVGVKVHEETLLPQTIATKLISHLKRAAEAALGVSVDSAVVTVPVYFTELHKGLTKDACAKAGFKNIQFIFEPVAAALAYGFESSIQSDETKTCLIYDLGGGTFDVTVFRLDAHQRIQIKATGGDDRLGGEDFNDLLTEYCLTQFQKLHGVNLAEEKASNDVEVRKTAARKLRRIRAQCERQKCYLASAPLVVVSLDGVHGDEQLVVPVTRTQFEELIGPLLNRSMKILDETLKKSGFKKEEIDDVILIGGSSRIPKVQQMVQEYFAGKQISRTIDADAYEAVACGAAVHAYNVFKKNAASFSVVTLLEETQLKPQSLKSASSVKLPAAASLPKTISWGSKINGFPPRSSHAAVAVGNVIYSFGGVNYSDDTSYSDDVLDVFVLNVNEVEKKWKKLPVENSEVNPNQRFGHSAVAHKEFVLIFGGWDTKIGKRSNSTYRFNTLTLKWDKPKVTGNVPVTRRYHSAVVVKNDMYIYGGHRYYGVTNELHCLNLQTFCWSTIEAKGIPPSIRQGHSATVHDDRFILIFGGWDYKENRVVNTIASFDIQSKTWTAVKTRGTPPSSRRDHCAFVHSGRMYIFGGFDGNYLNDVFSYDAETVEWKEVTPLGETPSPRYRAACVTFNDNVFIFGGEKEGLFKYCNDALVLQM